MTAVTPTETAITIPKIQAKGRQRGEGNLPVGKSSMRKRMEKTIEDCASVESHAATAPPGEVCEWSATVAYCPENSCTPAPRPETRKIKPMTFPGRRETISAPSVAKVGPIRLSSTQYP